MSWLGLDTFDFPDSSIISINEKKMIFSQSYEVIICMTGVSVFALFANTGFPLFLFAISGLLITGYIIYFTIQKNNSIFAVFGFSKFSKKVILYIITGLIIGILLGILYNIRSGRNILPHRFTGFVCIAAIIGSTEELIFRGYIAGRVRKAGKVFSIIISALSHTFYKFLLFLNPDLPYKVDMILLVECTFAAGLIIGFLREQSENILPPIAVHACFDIIVYGGCLTAPWWVW